MRKEDVVAAIGQQSLLLPAWVKSALAANDRLKLYLTLLQSAAQHANAPHTPVPDWGGDLVQAGLRDAAWMRDLPATAYYEGATLVLPQQEPFFHALSTDLALMTRPLCEGAAEDSKDLIARRDAWLKKIDLMTAADGLSPEDLTALTDGNRKHGDSFHILVMDAHKRLNALASRIATDNLDGAQVWQLDDEDRPLVQAFMRGLNRTAPLKFSHPGLETAATRDGGRLLIQNDIGTNDVHVLVVEVEGHRISLTYSDLHAERFAFFRGMLEEAGFQWKVFEPAVSGGLNAGKAYTVGKAERSAKGRELLDALEQAASRIVFVIDWNRARKRLQMFVRKPLACAILRQAAQEEWGHIAWLQAGGERLVFDAMQAADGGAFRIGDRLDDVLGEDEAGAFLLSLLRISSTVLRQQQPSALVADEARMLLVRAMQRHALGFGLLAEHAAYCHALADALCAALERSGAPEGEVTRLAARAKTWERQADLQLVDARQRAERHSRWLPVVDLLERSDNVADAIEEAIFIHSMTQAEPLAGLPAPVNEVLCRLAETTLAAVQDQVRAIETARLVSERADPDDSEQFLQTLWRMLRAERLCDDLSRQARMAIVRSLHASPAQFQLATELANTIEKASDHLLSAGYALRKLVLTKTGMPT